MPPSLRMRPCEGLASAPPARYTGRMRTIVRTVSIKLPEGQEAFARTLVAFAGALTLAGAFAKAQGLWSALALQKTLYGEIRERYGLKAQMTCSVFRQVAARSEEHTS